jgi:hypothetical protein
MIYLALISGAAISSLFAVVVALLRSMASERRAWGHERTVLINAALHPEYVIRPSQESNQRLPLSVEPPEDAAELNLVGQVIPIQDGKKNSKDDG